MAAEYKHFSISRALATELRTLHLACGRLRSPPPDNRIQDRTYRWGGEYRRLKLTESSIESITRDDSLARFLADASE